jgi:hypothetical protein
MILKSARSKPYVPWAFGKDHWWYAWSLPASKSHAHEPMGAVWSRGAVMHTHMSSIMDSSDISVGVAAQNLRYLYEGR